MVYCQPRFRDSSYHQLRSIQPSKSVTSVADPASMTKLAIPVGVQSLYHRSVCALSYDVFRMTGKKTYRRLYWLREVHHVRHFYSKVTSREPFFETYSHPSHRCGPGREDVRFVDETKPL